ncbi:MAG: long-chain fatty acid--CoA ligase [Deltaproteobacteria bacterium]|nr:long-chain fatty acid--CoA ligase [Deltaproteobacteria bacterium]
MPETPYDQSNLEHSGSARRHTTPIQGKTVASTYVQRVELSSTERAFLVKKGGGYHSIDWGEIHRRVLGIFASYQELNLKKGDRVCIFSHTRLEWSIADMATLCSGLVSVPIYQSNSVEEIVFILRDSDAKLVFAEDESLCIKLAQAFQQLGKLLPVVTFENTGPMEDLTVKTFTEFSSREGLDNFESSFRTTALNTKPEETASIVYTSGTTGQPKGAVLLHSCFSSTIHAIAREVEMKSSDVTLTFLPFAHILGRVESLWPLFMGITVAFAENINSIPANLSEVRPTLMVTVPRIFEKIYAKILSEVESMPKFRRSMFKWAVGIGRQVAVLHSEKQSVPLKLVLKRRVADRLVLSRIREKFGGRIRLTACGGAPLSSEVCEFFHGCGIKILEGYGLTETLGPMTVNRPDDFRFGTVGLPIGQVEIKIAEDGEVLIRGPMVFKEYFKNKQATAEAFTSDGWFRSGDVGAIDERGFLKITDRKKELIVTSGGKKIAPQKLENLLRASRFISHCMVCGDKEKFIGVLLTLNQFEIELWAKTHGLTYSSFEELTKHPKVVDLVDTEIKGVNTALAPFETMKKFRIIANDFSIETGELTPSLKVKRKFCAEKYRTYIQEMYF